MVTFYGYILGYIFVTYTVLYKKSGLKFLGGNYGKIYDEKVKE